MATRATRIGLFLGFLALLGVGLAWVLRSPPPLAGGPPPVSIVPSEPPPKPSEPPVDTPTPSTVTRHSFPTLDAPPFVKVKQPFDLRVTLTDLRRSNATTVDEGSTDEQGRLALELPADQAGWKIDVEVSAPGFEVVGEPAGTIGLGREGDSTTATFRLAALDLSTPAPERRVFVSLWYEGNFLARVSRTIKVRSAATVDAPAPAVATKVPVPPARRTNDGPLIDTNRLTPDMTIDLVADEAVPGRWSLYVTNAHGFLPVRATVQAPADFGSWLGAEFERFSGPLSRSGRRRDKPAPAAAVNELKGFGRRLWSTQVPPQVQKMFWVLHDTLGANFRSIQFYTNVPEFPWELARPFRREGPNGAEELDFLGISYRVGRWHVGREDAQQLARPPQEQPLEAVTAVVPKYPGDEELPGVKREVDAISQLNVASVVGGSRASLVKALGFAPRGIVHFAGHGVALAAGSANPSWAVKLENDDQLAVREWRGLTPMSAPPRLFFVNACELGQSERVAGFVDGWAPALLDTGASAYIGGLWPLGDTGASEFSRRFYVEVERALEAKEAVRVADVLSLARRGLYDSDDATFLGYVFYGDANLRLRP